MPTRCPWGESPDVYAAYHDTEWGVPLHDDQQLFEFLVLEGFQAGLSWLTILKKRDRFRHAFANFEVGRVARFGKRERERLLKDASIVRNRMKVDATIQNAKAFLEVRSEFGSFDAYIWAFMDGKPLRNRFRTMQEVPAKTPLAEKISKDLKRRGFGFVGPTIVYAHMQATGMVNDHLTTCFRHKECAQLSTR